MTAALALTGLRGGYRQTEVIRGVSFSIQPGEIFALIGKNGMGKSTLLKLVMGLLPVASGEVGLGGADMTGRSSSELVERGVSYVPQEQALFQDLTVDENLRLGALRLSREAFEERRREVNELFPFLAQRGRQRAGTLSGGEQKMLILARALLPSPQLVLVDEVSEGLQPMVITRIREALRRQRQTRNLSILLVEQNLDFALSLCDRFGVLKHGVVVEQDEPGAPGARSRAEKHLTI
jgi:branched-chain amino acid transport system ATP-binding protein